MAANALEPRVTKREFLKALKALQERINNISVGKLVRPSAPCVRAPLRFQVRPFSRTCWSLLPLMYVSARTARHTLESPHAGTGDWCRGRKRDLWSSRTGHVSET